LKKIYLTRRVLMRIDYSTDERWFCEKQKMLSTCFGNEPMLIMLLETSAMNWLEKRIGYGMG
jgi:hypothetical protein